MREEEFRFEGERYREDNVREQRIKDILDKEAILRKERQKLTSEKPWFRKPEIMVAVLGIIIPIIASYIISFSANDTKLLTVSNSNFEPIISKSNNLHSNLVISYDSLAVNNISKLTVKIKNSGNVSLVKSDFIDGPINFQINFDKSNPSTILQVKKKSDANQQSSKLEFKNYVNRSNIIYLPSLLNSGDEVVIEAFFLNTPNADFSIVGKLLNGEIKGPNLIAIKDSPLGYKTLILSINSIFSYKWLTIFVFIFLFMSTALSSVFQLAMVDDQEPKRLIVMLGIITFLISILSIVIIISVLYYV